MRTFIFKAYSSKRNRKLHRQIDVAASIWNHCIALHKRYYRRFQKHLNQFQLMKHITKLKKLRRFGHWKSLGSQAAQDVVQRIEKGYQAFFKNLRDRKSKRITRKVFPPSLAIRFSGKAAKEKQIDEGIMDLRRQISQLEFQINELIVKRNAL